MTTDREFEDSLCWMEEHAGCLDEIADLEKPYLLERYHSQRTPLEMAVKTHRRDVVDGLIRRGAKTENLESRLYSCGWDFEDIDELCYQRGIMPCSAMMHRTLRENNIERLKYLVDMGGDLNAPAYVNDDGDVIDSRTLLDMAIQEGTLKVVKHLMQWGAATTQQAISCALRRRERSVEMTEFLLEAGAVAHANSLLGLCTGSCPHPRNERGALIAMLLEYGVDPNAAFENGATPLMHESGRGETGLMRLLLSHGADWRIRNNDGLSAVDVARKTNRPEAIALLESLPA